MITSRIFKKLGSRIKASRRTFSHLVAPHPRSEAPDYYGLIQRKVMCLKAEIPSTPKLAVSNVNRHLGPRGVPIQRTGTDYRSKGLSHSLRNKT